MRPAKKAIEGNLARCGEEGTVTLRSDYGFYDVDYKLRGTPLVSILIPNKDQADTLRTCLESIKKKCMYPSYEILIIENNSTEEATFSYYQELEAQGIRVLKYPKQGFNYSAINNFGVKEAKGEYLLFLNNDMEIITPDFMEKIGVQSAKTADRGGRREAVLPGQHGAACGYHHRYRRYCGPRLFRTGARKKRLPA